MAIGACAKSIAGFVLRRSAAPVAAMALFASVGVNSASADVTYTSYTWIGDNIHILSPHVVSGGAGQIALHLNNNTTLFAWCLDVYDDLQNKGVYSVTPNGSINGGNTASTPGHIGALMLEGNNLIAANQGYLSWSVADISAAIQVAIWTAEYGAASFSYNVLPTNFASLVTHVDGLATALGNVAYATLDPDTAACTSQTCNYDGAGHLVPNQHLGYVPTPGPIAGAGMPGILAACVALIAFARRRRRALA